jgi:hypothetical protein
MWLSGFAGVGEFAVVVVAVFAFFAFLSKAMADI